jgi:hypothetical protein
MPRRYRLCEPSERRCDLTGVVGLSFVRYERWPNGLQYDSRDWWTPFTATVEVREWIGGNWVPKQKAQADGDDGSKEDAGSEATGTVFLKSRGALRFNQWLELSLGDPPPLRP